MTAVIRLPANKDNVTWTSVNKQSTLWSNCLTHDMTHKYKVRIFTFLGIRNHHLTISDLFGSFTDSWSDLQVQRQTLYDPRDTQPPPDHLNMFWELYINSEDHRNCMIHKQHTNAAPVWDVLCGVLCVTHLQQCVVKVNHFNRVLSSTAGCFHVQQGVVTSTTGCCYRQQGVVIYNTSPFSWVCRCTKRLTQSNNDHKLASIQQT